MPYSRYTCALCRKHCAQHEKVVCSIVGERLCSRCFSRVYGAIPGANLVPFDSYQALSFTVDEQLVEDVESLYGLVRGLVNQQYMWEENDGSIPRVILELNKLMRDLYRNLVWLAQTWVLAEASPRVRPLFMNSTEEAAELADFFSRDGLLQAKFRDIHDEALNFDSWHLESYTIFLFDIFERYTSVHRPRLVKNASQEELPHRRASV